MPTVSAPSSQRSSISLSSSIRCAGTPAARATSTRRFEFDELREPITSRTSISREEILDRPLAVGGRVADVLFLRPDDLREAPAQGRDDLGGLVDRERRLGDVREPGVGRELERLGLGDVLHEDRRVRRLAHRADDLLVPGVADQEHGVAVGRVALRLDMDLRHERAGRVDHVVAEGRGVRVHRRGDAVRRVDDRRATRRVTLVVDEDRAAGLEVAHHVEVVDDLLADVDRRAVVLERPLDRLDGALDSCAVAARGGEEDAPDAHARQGYCPLSQRDVCASTIPVRTIAPPASCAAERVSSSHTHATIDASTTSIIATIETRVAGRWWSAPEREREGEDRPQHDHPEERSQTGALVESRRALERHGSQSASNGKPHQGCTIAQKAAATPSEMQVRESASRRASRAHPRGSRSRGRRRRERGGDADRVEPRVLPDLARRA